MYIIERTARFVRGFLLSYGPSDIKKRIWDQEFSGSKWNFIDNTSGDCVYPFLEKTCRTGIYSIWAAAPVTPRMNWPRTHIKATPVSIFPKRPWPRLSSARRRTAGPTRIPSSTPTS